MNCKIVGRALVAFALVSCALAQQTKAPRDETGAAHIASVWDGVFTEAQARRGKEAYPAPCGTCHGRRLNGAPEDPDVPSTPPVGRAKFLRNWEGRTLATLFEYTRATMPENNPGYLADQEYIDVIAYMLSISGIPAGQHELRPDPKRLSEIVVEQRP